jgi:hypothetical protein
VAAWGSPSWEKEDEEGREARLEAALPRVALVLWGVEAGLVREVKEEAEVEAEVEVEVGVALLPGLLAALVGVGAPPRYRAPPGEPGEGMGLPP